MLGPSAGGATKPAQARFTGLSLQGGGVYQGVLYVTHLRRRMHCTLLGATLAFRLAYLAVTASR